MASIFLPASAGALAVAESGGFNPLDPAAGGNTLWTIVIFVVSLPFIWRIVMGPVSRALEERDEHASRAIAQAEKASAEADKARAEVEVALGEAQAEAAKLLAQARERAEVREKEIVEAAKQEAANMVDSARKAIRAEKDKAISTIRNEVVDLSLKAASRVVERNVGGEDDERLVRKMIEESQAVQN